MKLFEKSKKNELNMDIGLFLHLQIRMKTFIYKRITHLFILFLDQHFFNLKFTQRFIYLAKNR